LPPVVSPGAAHQPPKDDDGASQCQPELHHQPSALGAPAQLAEGVQPGVTALDDPPLADLDRGGQPPTSDLSGETTLGQFITNRLVVVAAVQVDGRLFG
jgi:hypothetical protein